MSRVSFFRKREASLDWSTIESRLREISNSTPSSSSRDRLVDATIFRVGNPSAPVNQPTFEPASHCGEGAIITARDPLAEMLSIPTPIRSRQSAAVSFYFPNLEDVSHGDADDRWGQHDFVRKYPAS